MLDTSARLLRLLSVLQARRSWSGADLAARLEVTPRTLRRDVDRLRSLGYMVEATAGHGGGYQLGKGSALPPLLLDDEEAVAAAVALRSASDTFEGLAGTSERLLAKLEQLLPARLRDRIGAVQAMTVSIPCEQAALPPERLSTLAVSCRDCIALHFAYRDRTGACSQRHVEPLRLAHAGRRWYLLARDRDRADWRTFRVDRIEGALQPGDRFVPSAPPGGVSTYLADSLSVSHQRYRARVLLRGTLDELATAIPSWAGILESRDEKSCVLQAGAATIEGLASQLLFCGRDFELLEPEEMGPLLRDVAARIERALAPGRRSTSR